MDDDFFSHLPDVVHSPMTTSAFDGLAAMEAHNAIQPDIEPFMSPRALGASTAIFGALPPPVLALSNDPRASAIKSLLGAYRTIIDSAPADAVAQPPGENLSTALAPGPLHEPLSPEVVLSLNQLKSKLADIRQLEATISGPVEALVGSSSLPATLGQGPRAPVLQVPVETFGILSESDS